MYRASSIPPAYRGMRFYNLTILTNFYGGCTTVAPERDEGKATSCPVELKVTIQIKKLMSVKS
jgi:hypothetical protein